LILPSLLLSLTCSSCDKEDPRLLEKREQQKAEIVRLTGELNLLEEKLKNLPPDVTKDLEKAAQQAEQQAAEVIKLEAEAADLDARKRALQKEFDAYRAKYPVP
jgi:chromosome segregation ATPase